MIQHLYTLWCIHHGKSINCLWPCKLIMMLLTIFPVLHTTSQWIIYFITGSLSLLRPFTFSFIPPTPSPVATITFFCASMNLYIYVLFICSFVFGGLFVCWRVWGFFSTYVWNHTIFIFLHLTYFTCIISSRSTYVVNDKISFIFLLLHLSISLKFLFL